MRNNKTVKLAISGIYLALTLAMMFAASVIPGIELSILAITSAIGAFVIIESGIKFGVVFYVAASVLGLLIVPNKLQLIPYIMFFGLYPAVKYLAEKLPKAPLQMTVKLAYFVVVLLIAYFALFEVFFSGINLHGAMQAVIIPAAIVMFLLLDAILSGIINIYFKKVHSRFNEN